MTAESAQPRKTPFPRAGSGYETWLSMVEQAGLANELDRGQPYALQGSVTLEYVQARVIWFKERFNYLKRSTQATVEMHQISIPQIAEFLTSLPADKTHGHLRYLSKVFGDLKEASDHSQLFISTKYHLNYAWYHMLDLLIKEFHLKEMEREMEVYKKDFQHFKHCVTLVLFCQTEKKRVRPPDFSEVIAKFAWPNDTLLERVEQFKLDYLDHFDLHDYVMVLSFIQCPGLFIVSWFVPDVVINVLKVRVPHELMEKYSTVSLIIAGEQMYSKPEQQVPCSITATSLSTTSVGLNSPSSLPDIKNDKENIQPEKEINKTEEDSLCPVICGLLQQPYLVEHHGNHLTQEVITRIVNEIAACPLCNHSTWRAIADVFRAPEVKCPDVAENIEKIFCLHATVQAVDSEGGNQNHIIFVPNVRPPHIFRTRGINEKLCKVTTKPEDEDFCVPMSAVHPTGVNLGCGSYFDVVEVEYRGKKYAAKKQRVGKNMERLPGTEQAFQTEHKILACCVHPNIVQYNGIFTLPKVIVVERMDMTLMNLLERQEMKLGHKLQILYDVAQGLHFLHTQRPAIIHRDLTATNILLNSKGVAKISDFGNSCMVDLTTTPELLTSRPGTLDYMPPEALEGGQYNDKLDIFSFGHLSIYVVIQHRPHPLLRHTYRERGRLFPRTEVERCTVYLDETKSKLGGDQHPLYSTIISCLQDEPDMRPSCADILQSGLFSACTHT